MKFSFTKDIIRDIKRYRRKDPQIYRKVIKQLAIFKSNHRHPSLRSHKLKGELSNTWSISIGEDLRMLYYLSGDEAVFFLIGTHDEVYRKGVI